MMATTGVDKPDTAVQTTPTQVTNPTSGQSPTPPIPASSSSSSSSSSLTFPKPKVLLLPSLSSSASTTTSTAAAATFTPPLPGPNDEEVKPTMAELQAAFATTIQNNKRAGLGPDAPLMTQTMRQKHEAKFGIGGSRKTFDEIHIRFRFSDRTLLEYTLPSTTPLAHLYPLLRSALSPTHSSKPFILYTSPPKVDFPEENIKGPAITPSPSPSNIPGRAKAVKKVGEEFRGKTVGQMGWGGGAIVSIRWVGKGDEGLNLTSSIAPIREDLKSQGRPLEAPRMGEGAKGSDATASNAAGSGAQTLSSTGGESKEKKMPKWFKGIGGKK